MTTTAVFWGLSFLAVIGAVVSVTSHDILRTAAGLGAFLLAVAGYFALYGAGLLALAEIFLYVGGVLVLMLFAIMLVHRSERGRPDLETRATVPSVLAPLALVFTLVVVFAPLGQTVTSSSVTAGPDQVATELLGRYLPQFEVAGLLLLAALAAVVAVMGGDDS